MPSNRPVRCGHCPACQAVRSRLRELLSRSNRPFSETAHVVEQWTTVAEVNECLAATT